ncbi:AraC family transcriptional regulator [Gryllotalpicola protaetiae]|uniref:AraC family transcriptional regulator n=1 Tax=Gryllotalpicola protaetiae TaxID=2419771 RepID=A0A387BPE3_9MICO|nr:AraC family transcriptional regulator [Gryllotalpicola protaetiae]AYG04352.1 AraC family transcriptional regulator [Gryllotalpicola protaetiae]
MDLSRLAALIARHAPSGQTRIGDSAVISSVGREGPPEFSMTGTVFVLLARGGKRIAVGDQVHEYRPGQSFIASVDLPAVGSFFDATAERPALGFAVTLKPALVAELLLHPAAASLPRQPRAATPAAVSVAELTPGILDAVTRMAALAGSPDDVPVLAPLVERELTWLLLRGAHGPAVRQLGLADSSLNRVAHAVALLRERFAESIRIDELAAVARMSPSAFHRGFQAVTATSPIQFQKQLRLQEARVRLLAGGGDVAGVAYAVGYESPSQFSRDYKRQFGATPREHAAG